MDLQTFVALLPVFLGHFVLILPHLLLLLVLSLILGFPFALHFILLHLHLVLPLFYLPSIRSHSPPPVGTSKGSCKGRGRGRGRGTAMVGVYHLPLVHPLIGDVVGAGNMVGVGRQEGVLFL